MQCPKCRLENPPSTETCDCGYSFVTRSFVPKPSSRSGTYPSIGQEKSRYSALESISKGARVAAWLMAAFMVIAGIVILLNLADQQKTFAIPTAIAFFGAAAGQWLVFTVIAEAIMLFVDIAYDVRAIAIKINSSDGR
jgi:hypothetical protein